MKTPRAGRAASLLWILGLLSILAVAPAVRAAAGPLDAFEQAMLRGDYAAAVTLAERLAVEHPESSIVAWHLGCARSRAGDADAAITSLLRAAELGFSGTRSVRDEDDLDPVRGHPRFAEVVAAVEAAATRRFTAFQAAAREAEPVVVLPPGHDPGRPAPLLIALHGTGGTGAGTARAWRAAAAASGAILVAPDALRPVGEGYGWTFRDESEWYVIELVRQARERWAIDRVVLAGFSQGANIALMLGQSHPQLFDAVMPVGGHYEADTADLPAAGLRPRWALVIGARDPWADTYVAAERAFAAAGMSVQRTAVRGLGHAFPAGGSAAVVRRALAWCLEGPVQSVAPAPAPAPAAIVPSAPVPAPDAPAAPGKHG